MTADTPLSSVAASGPGSSPHCQRTTPAGGGSCSNPAGALTLDLKIYTENTDIGYRYTQSTAYS